VSRSSGLRHIPEGGTDGNGFRVDSSPRRIGFSVAQQIASYPGTCAVGESSGSGGAGHITKQGNSLFALLIGERPAQVHGCAATRKAEVSISPGPAAGAEDRQGRHGHDSPFECNWICGARGLDMSRIDEVQFARGTARKSALGVPLTPSN